MTAHAYNSIGELVTTADADGETKYQYNSKGQLSYVVNPTGEVVRYTYDDYGRKTVLTYPDGRTVAYAYDEMDRLTGVKGLDGTKTTYAYDAAGRRTETKSGTLTTTYAYDAIGNLTKQETTGKTQLTLEYLYDLNNRMTGETRTQSGETVKSTYVYDKLGQLTAFTKSDGYSERYAYDAAGNMLEKVKNSQKIAMTYDAANELKTMTASNGTINYAYDANGNLTQKTMAAYTDTYAYNVKNQLTNYSGYDGYQQRYTYNAQGHMVKRESKGSASRQTLEAIATGEGESAAAIDKDGGSDDDPDPYANASSSDAWSTTTYVYDVTAPYYEVLSETTDGVTTAYDYGVERISAYEKIGWSTLKTDYVYDGRGSVAQELTYNSSWYTFGGFLSNKGVNSYTYTPFGELLTGEGAGFRFNGEYYDRATGMLNLRARQYEPAVMRFEQRDVWHGAQIIATTQNRYLYCMDDPINLYDYSGKVITGKNAGVRLPISKPIVDLTKENPTLKNSLSDSIARLAALTSTGIDTTGYNDAQRKVVEEAEKKLFEEATHGTLTEEKRKSIISTACYETYWARDDGYFNGYWWQSDSKRTEAYQMLLLEAQVKGSLDLISIDKEKPYGEINNKILGFQDIVNAARTGVWDAGTLNAIENGLVASGIAGSYKVTPEELAILSGREIIGRETGYWLESAGYPEMLNNAALLLLLFDISLDNNPGASSGQSADIENAEILNQGYKAPTGGGGVTNTIKTGEITVTFGHGGRHVLSMDVASVEQAIAYNVPALEVGEYYSGTVNVNGVEIIFRAFGRDEGVINIGTYFPK